MEAAIRRASCRWVLSRVDFGWIWWVLALSSWPSSGRQWPPVDANGKWRSGLSVLFLGPVEVPKVR